MIDFDRNDRNKQKLNSLAFARGMKGVAVTPKPKAKYSLIDEEISLPVAVINKQALTNNMDWMQTFANYHGVKLCPHGKTTMTPEFFAMQKAKGAWGITVATAPQAETAACAGLTNIMIANQLVGRANMAMVARIKQESQARVIVCVDSKLNADQLNQFFSTTGSNIEVLIEYGVVGGRCGCRSRQEVIELAKHISTLRHVSLVGIEVYEGVIHGGDEESLVRAFLTNTIALGRELIEQELLPSNPILTGAGSAWYDVVAETFAHLPDFEAIIRPGCYVIHDTGIYLEAQEKVMARATKNGGYACDLGGDLSSSLEVWAYVISRPEPTKAIVGLGKRDVAFDAGLPIPERIYRAGNEIQESDIVATDVMDQHTFLSISAESSLQVGDMIAFSTSHPCLTFDKWRLIAISDDEYFVDQWVETAF
ncbi:D-threonine aldolase [Vibrio thalassae]|uniref:D-threonine aldolase n=1 Tax=Vibrio thalassae TaxID=1243014 RepID=A0A240EJZ4_9VIBR|nr:D-threonine aldolase [Vibrio thalassae]